MVMMPISQPPNANLLDRSNSQEPTSITSIRLYAGHPAASSFPDSATTSAGIQPRSMHVPRQDAFIYYNALVETSSCQGSERNLTSDGDGYICHEHAGAADLQDVGRARPVPHNLSARLANRSNGAPLATIIEQGSHSTLNSHGSMLSIGPLPTLRVVENAAPGRGSQKLSRTLDENVQHPTLEDAQQGQRARATHEDDPPHKLENFGSLHPICNTPVGGPTSLQHLHPAASQLVETGSDTNSKTVKTFFRGVLQNVRAVSQPRTRSQTRSPSRSSSTHASIVEHAEDGPAPSDSSPESHSKAPDTPQLGHDRCDTPCCEASSVMKTTLADSQARSWSISTPHATSSVCADTPLLAVLPRIAALGTCSGDIPYPPPSVIATCSRQRPSVRLVPPEPRDPAHAGCTAATSAHLHETGDGATVGHALYGVSVYSNTVPSLVGIDRARETSRNASFCSTTSTSYSGTVVGVDIDLQHDFSHPIRRSRSPTPVAPVWFTPQMAELERQATVSESPESEPNQVSEVEPPRRSITSSALTSLLPIAAASGIVRPNYNTPEISFFSPSGNLIQPEGSSTPGTISASDITGSPTMTSPYQDKNTKTTSTYKAFPPPTCLPPPRPSLRPMTTPPTSSAPLPAHLRHHHNYRHVEQSQIDSTISSTESFIVPALAVKGCGGIVKSGSFTFRIGIRPSHDKTRPQPHYRRHRSARSFTEDLGYELKFYRARLITTIVTSCTTEGKGKALRKRQASHRRAAATAYISMPQNATTAAAAGKKRVHDRKRDDVGLLGPLAGHALRICFCQPYDGAGNSTQDFPCTNRHTEPIHGAIQKESPRSRTKELYVDAVLPNVRVVSGTDYKISSSKSVHMSKHGAVKEVCR